MSALDVSSQLDEFFSQFQAFSFKEGDTIIYSNSPIEFVYYLKSGIVKQRSLSSSGEEATLNLLKKGAFFPLIWAVNEKHCPYDFIALTNGHGWRAPKKAVVAFLKSHADVTFDLMLRLLSGLEGMSRKLDFALQQNAAFRIQEALLTLAYRFGKKAEQEVVIDLSLTHQDLAEITGLTRETVTRSLKILVDQGFIRVEDHKFVIPQLSKIEESIAFH